LAFLLADVSESGTAWLSTTFAAVVFTLISRPKIDGRLDAASHPALRLTDAGADIAVPAVAGGIRWGSPRRSR
jgi:hypothetical protein